MSSFVASVVVGAEGMVGRRLAERLVHAGEPVVQTMRTSRPGAVPLDLALDVCGWVPPCAVTTAYLCAATTSIEYCRNHPATSHAVNVEGTAAVAATLAACGAHVVFPSSNLVFDGSMASQDPAAPVTPATEYGRQKAEAETRLLKLPGSIGIVRFAKILGPQNPLLMLWATALRQGHAIHPISDMVAAPVSLDFAVEVLVRAGVARLQGILHVSAAEDVSYEVIARHLASRIGAGQRLVQPVLAADSGLNFEHVPRHTTLNTQRLREELGITPPDPWLAIDAAFASLSPSE